MGKIQSMTAVKNITFSQNSGNVGCIASIREILREVSEDICDNYCKYRETADEECLCDVIREGGSCPLDKLNQS